MSKHTLIVSMLDVHVAKETVYFVIPFQNCHKDFFL
jgi:hypothetical protein